MSSFTEWGKESLQREAFKRMKETLRMFPFFVFGPVYGRLSHCYFSGYCIPSKNETPTAHRTSLILSADYQLHFAYYSII